MLRTVVPAVLMFAAFTISSGHAEVRTYALPGEAVFPEGITIDYSENTFYVGSTNGGTIFRGDITSGKVDVAVPAGAHEPMTGELGLHLDAKGHLWAAGGSTGYLFAIDPGTGRVLGSFAPPDLDNSFLQKILRKLRLSNNPGHVLNDIAIVNGTVYVTDTTAPVLWRIPADRTGTGQLEPWIDLTESPIEYVGGKGAAGANLNGIVATPDNRYLIVVQLNKGELFRIGIEDRTIHRIDLNGATVKNGDGLVLDGQKLYVVQNADQMIALVDLSDNYAKGDVRTRFTHPELKYPTTATKVGDKLLVVNAQFDRRDKPELPFSIISIPTDLIAGSGS
jgi:sugar lactone lactonase YvrE